MQAGRMDRTGLHEGRVPEYCIGVMQYNDAPTDNSVVVALRIV
jgi:hypothetical protein